MSDLTTAIETVLTRPMPIMGSWERVYADRIDVVLQLVRGEIEPGDVQPEQPFSFEAISALAGMVGLKPSSLRPE